MPISEKTRQLLESHKNKIEQSKVTPDAALPGKQRVEDLIGTREESLTSGVKDIKSFFTDRNSVAGTLPRGLLKTAGGILRRGEAGIANVADVLQTGDISRSIPEEFMKGVKGERLGELGDVIRRTDIGKDFNLGPVSGNDFISGAVGFTAMAGLTDLATKGKIVEGVNKMVSSMKKGARIRKVASLRKKAGFFKQKAEQFSQGIDDAFSGMRQSFDDLYKKIGDNVIGGDDAINMQDIAIRVSQAEPKVIRNVEKLASIKGRGSFASKTGRVIEGNINNAKILKTEIGRAIPRKVWSGIDEATEAQARMMDDYFELNNIIANNAGKLKPDLLRINAKFSRLHKLNRGIRPQLKSGAGITKTTIRNIHSEAQQGNLEAMTKFSNQFFKQGRDILREIKIYNRNKKIIKGLEIGGGVVGGGGILAEFIKRPIQKQIRSQGSLGGSDFRVSGE